MHTHDSPTLHSVPGRFGDVYGVPATKFHTQQKLDSPVVFALTHSSYHPPIMAAAFPLPSRIPSWFAGHMASSLRTLPSVLQNIDMVIEVRDARLPLTSVNPAFEQALSRAWGYQTVSAGLDRKGKGREVDGGKEKVVVYTKRDLAERRYEEVRLSVHHLCTED